MDSITERSRYDRCLRYANLRRGTWNCGRKGDKPEEICELFAAKPEEMTLVCTGRVLDEKIREAADEVYNIAPEK